MAIFLHGIPQRDPHNKKEEGEHKIGRRTAMPFGMAQRGINMIPASGSVYDDHEGNSKPSEDIERYKPGATLGHYRYFIERVKITQFYLSISPSMLFSSSLAYARNSSVVISLW